MTTEERLPLALRYRPRKLSELTGQRHVAAVLGKALASGELPQQLLFSGGSGLGKTTTARIAAAAICCETPLADRPGGDACGTCASCVDITTPGRVHPDVIELDAASHGGKDEIRDLGTSATLSPLRATKKVYIIDEAHGLTGPGGQAFLKLLEEPPPHVVFMLCTTDPQKLAKANRGRCTEFELLRPSDAELIANLKRVAAGEGWVLSDGIAAAVVAATNPDLGVRGTVMTLEKLSGVLSAGVDPSEEQVGELLGVASGAAMGRLCEAVNAAEVTQALEQLAVLRNGVGDESIRSALTTWARAGLKEATAGRGLSVEEAVRRLRVLAEAAPGPLWTDLAVMELACPALHPTPEALAAKLAEAERLIGELTARTVEAEKLAAQLRAATQEAKGAHVARPGPAPATPAANRSPAGTATSPGHSQAQPPARTPDTGTSPTSSSAAGTPGPDDRARVLVSRVETADRRVGAMLRSCQAALSADTVTLTAGAGLIERLSSHRDVIDTAAAGLGLKVTLHAS